MLLVDDCCINRSTHDECREKIHYTLPPQFNIIYCLQIYYRPTVSIYRGSYIIHIIPLYNMLFVHKLMDNTLFAETKDKNICGKHKFIITSL